MKITDKWYNPKQIPQTDVSAKPESVRQHKCMSDRQFAITAVLVAIIFLESFILLLRSIG
jgi:hypothetical protein